MRASVSSDRDPVVDTGEYDGSGFNGLDPVAGSSTIARGYPMTNEYDDERPTTDLIDESDAIDEFGLPNAAETAASMVGNGLDERTVALAAGGVVLLSALRSLRRRRLGAVPKTIAGGALVGYGLRARRSVEEATTDSSTEMESAAADEESRIEFTEATEESEPRSKPTLEADDTRDPRRNTDDDRVSIDVSDSATADEVGEAAGPDPEQAQPTQTDSIEPEETPDEDTPHSTGESADGSDGNDDPEHADGADSTDAGPDES
ncbi:hypothetical protein EA462_15295 [Natrarchaeobius halalkaliphilus]|uniref:Uncharacterized protein n=1 Tax=Natrarchaeobius halalkaliphilus TaxID=1679091 RepID=A0A3N6LKM3_9EURY|nr:hypothetical protein [Natrarchaeobius halalkaliphilus]RQG87008.1 hypothetical protein EA462_15295 [Natrarchaeobius halalkaliphilus]